MQNSNSKQTESVSDENVMETLRMDMHICTYKHITFCATTVRVILMSPIFD